MSPTQENTAAPVPSGLEVRHIQTRTVQRTIDGQLVDVIEPVLDDQGREIVLSSVRVPQAVEAHGADEIALHVAEELALRDAMVAASTTPSTSTSAEGAES